MKQAQAYLCRKNFESYVCQRIMDLTHQGKVVNPDAVNAYHGDVERASADILVSGKTQEASRNNTIDFILDGGLIFQFLFAGAATRAADVLKDACPAKYCFNRDYFIQNADGIISNYKHELKKETEPLRKINIMETITALQESKKDFERKRMLGISLGARQIFQYRITLEKLALKRKRNIRSVLKNIFFLVHVNEDYKDIIIEDFVRNGFFGFQMENIIFVVQENFEGYVFRNRKLEKVPDKRRPFGHGCTLMQTVVPGSGFILGNGSEMVPVAESPLDHICSHTKTKDLIMGNINVDDLTKLSDLIIDVERVNYAIEAIFRKGMDVVVEGVWNRKGQKGGSWVRNTKLKKSMLVEGLCLKSKRFDQLFFDDYGAPKEISQIPLLNKMSNFYWVDALLESLPGEGLPLYLDIREGVIYLESITGDVTHLDDIKTGAFVKIDPAVHSPEEIRTFKDSKDTYQLLSSMREQDRDPEFVRFVRQFGKPAR